MLQKENENLRTIIDSSPLIIWCKDKEGKILLANRKAAKMFGYSVKNIIGKCCPDFHPNPTFRNII